MAFIWGQGGQRLTPEEIERRRANAASLRQQGSNTAPAGHWLEGLNRVMQGVQGGLQERSARKASEANKAEANTVLQALMKEGGADQSSLMGAAMNQYIPPEMRQMAAQQYQTQYGYQKPVEVNGRLVNPRTGEVVADFQSVPEVIKLSRIAHDPKADPYDRQTARDYLSVKTDPTMTTNLPGGGIYMGPRSEFATILGGGAPVGQPMPPAQSAPDRLPPNFFSNGGAPNGGGNFPR